MKPSKARHLIWIIPFGLFALGAHQARVLTGLTSTYENGEELTAFVEDFDIKHISSQTNGYVVLRYHPVEGGAVTTKLSLPVQVAARIQGLAAMQIRHKSDSSMPVVMVGTYPFQRRMVVVNLAILAVSFTITVLVATHFSRKQPA
jgi:hypothetical protein